MNKEKVKLIIHNMELLIRSLKEEVLEDKNFETSFYPYMEENDVDEYYSEEDDV